MNRKKLLETGKRKCQLLLDRYPGNTALLSISKQIDYLIGVEYGSIVDRTELKDIIIGVITAREIEPLDQDAAETFHQIASEAREM